MAWSRENGGWRIGAMTPHAKLEHNADLGVLARAAGTIADPQVRNRGTIGGSLAHGDPASDLPAVLLIAEGSVTVKGPGGQRSIAAGDLFQDYLETVDRPQTRFSPRCGSRLWTGTASATRSSTAAARTGRWWPWRLWSSRPTARLRGRPRRTHQHGIGAAAGERR